MGTVWGRVGREGERGRDEEKERGAVRLTLGVDGMDVESPRASGDQGGV